MVCVGRSPYTEGLNLSKVGVKKDELFFNGGRTLGEDSNWDWDAKFDLETQIFHLTLGQNLSYNFQ